MAAASVEGGQTWNIECLGRLCARWPRPELGSQPRSHPQVVIIAAILFTGLSAPAANWPQFRGPCGQGVDDSQTLATHWDVEAATNIRWQTPLPGLAHASPIVWGDRVFVATAVKPGKADLKVGLYGDITPLEEKDVHQWRLLALDKKTGKIIWDTLGYEGVPRAPRHPKATACNSHAGNRWQPHRRDLR